MSRRPDWLIGQLPMGMLDDDFFVRFVSLFQELSSSLMDGADNIPNVVDRTVSPPEVLRWLGSWLGISLDSSLPEEAQRRLVALAGQNLTWRGTRRGLEGFLGELTGAPAEIEESGAVLPDTTGPDVPSPERPRTVSIRCESPNWYFLSEADFVALVADEIPTNVAWELYVGGRQLFPMLSAPPRNEGLS